MQFEIVKSEPSIKFEDFDGDDVEVGEQGEGLVRIDCPVGAVVLDRDMAEVVGKALMIFARDGSLDKVEEAVGNQEAEKDDVENRLDDLEEHINVGLAGVRSNCNVTSQELFGRLQAVEHWQRNHRLADRTEALEAKLSGAISTVFGHTNVLNDLVSRIEALERGREVCEPPAVESPKAKAEALSKLFPVGMDVEYRSIGGQGWYRGNVHHAFIVDRDENVVGVVRDKLGVLRFASGVRIPSE